MQKELLNDWTDPKCIHINVIIMDISNLLPKDQIAKGPQNQEFSLRNFQQNQIMKNKKEPKFTLKNRGESMRRLTKQMQKSGDNKYTKTLSVA